MGRKNDVLFGRLALGDTRVGNIGEGQHFLLPGRLGLAQLCLLFLHLSRNRLHFLDFGQKLRGALLQRSHLIVGSLLAGSQGFDL